MLCYCISEDKDGRRAYQDPYLLVLGEDGDGGWGGREVFLVK